MAQPVIMVPLGVTLRFGFVAVAVFVFVVRRPLLAHGLQLDAPLLSLALHDERPGIHALGQAASL